jgi:cystathionine beta-lyase/cystathionine gamma-synthase
LPVNSHIIASDDLYGGSYRMFERIRKQSAGLQATYIDMTDPGAIEQAIRPETKLIWLETPSNPLLKLIDLPAVAAIAKKHNLISVADNTFATPWIQQPLAHGFDLVVHSLTKYLNGHSDMVGGAVIVGENTALRDQLAFLHYAIGSVLGPFDSYLALRGLKTLDLRLTRQCESALKIAEWLERHPKITKVHYPGLPSHPQHALALRQMRGFGGIITAVIAGGLEPSRRMLSACRFFTLAESLGAVESLIEHPAIMTHASIPPAQRAALGISDGMIRLSVGIETVDDLIADLEQALEQA